VGQAPAQSAPKSVAPRSVPTFQSMQNGRVRLSTLSPSNRLSSAVSVKPGDDIRHDLLVAWFIEYIVSAAFVECEGFVR
jgi:hypothetical protein